MAKNGVSNSLIRFSAKPIQFVAGWVSVKQIRRTNGQPHTLSRKRTGSIRGQQRAGGTSARTASGSSDRRPCYQMSSSMLWRIDNNALANDEVRCSPVDAGPNHFEFERVIAGQ